MKNIIMLVLDSFSLYELNYLISRAPESMDFFESFKKECVDYTNVFSQGPHTEIGIRGLVCGRNALEDGGSSRFLRDEMLFSEYINKGYQVDYVAKPFIYVSSELRSSSSFRHHYTGFQKFKYLWPNRLEHYKRVGEDEQKFSLSDKQSIIDLVGDMFDTLRDFWTDVANDSADIQLIANKVSSLDCPSVKKSIEYEYALFLSNPWEYSTKLIEDFDKNPLVGLTDIDENCNQLYPSIKYAYEHNKELLKKMENRQLLINAVPPGYVIREVVKHFRSRRQNELWTNYHIRLNSNSVFGYKSWPVLDPSIRKQLDYAFDILRNDRRHGSNSPRFIYLQPEEMHYHHSFFSYDYDDPDLIDREFGVYRDFFSKHPMLLGPGYLSTTLAYLYVNTVLKDFWRQLKEEGLADEVDIVITSDHGSSFGHAPLRDGLLFNNIYSENYHIPLFVYDGSNSGVYDGMLENVDIGKAIGKQLSGESIKGRKIVHTEYLGAGFQDIYRKKIVFTASDGKYRISYVVGMKETFEDGVIQAFFDLESDPLERRKIPVSFNDERITRLLQFLKNRHKEIQDEYLN